MDAKTDNPAGGYGALVVSLAIVVAFLGANPFADAVGFPGRDYHDTPMPAFLRAVCGAVVFFATYSFLRFLVGHVRAVVRQLGATAAKPDRWLSLAGLICGTLCLLAALFVQVYAATHPVGVRVAPTMTFNGGMPGGSMNMEAHSEGSLALTLVSVLTFLFGAGLLAFGIWGSLKHAPGQPVLPGSVAKPDGWGEAAIDAARV